MTVYPDIALRARNHPKTCAFCAFCAFCVTPNFRRYAKKHCEIAPRKLTIRPRLVKGQKNQRTKSQKQNKNTKGNIRKLPSLQETEAYIKEHNLTVMNPLSDFGFKRLLASERNRILYMFTNVVYLQQDEINTLTPMQMRFYEEYQINNFTD